MRLKQGKDRFGRLAKLRQIDDILAVELLLQVLKELLGLRIKAVSQLIENLRINVVLKELLPELHSVVDGQVPVLRRRAQRPNAQHNSHMPESGFHALDILSDSQPKRYAKTAGARAQEYPRAILQSACKMG